MEPLKNLSHSDIQDGLQRGINSAIEKVLNPFGFNNYFSHAQLEELIGHDIKGLHFTINYSPSLIDPTSKQSVPSFINLNGFDRKAGGVIKLNRQYPRKALREALFHEYAHLKDDTLPILNSDLNAPNSRATYVRAYMKLVEFHADVIAYTLMMPPWQIVSDLLTNAYDIDKIIEKYVNIEKSSIFQWITLINPLPCHFAWIILEKDTNENIIRSVIHDDCYYDHQVDPRQFNIESIISYHPDSAAATALRERGDVKKESNIFGTEYYCYAYYEENLSLEVIKDLISPCPNSVHYDRLLVIGWTKAIDNMIKNMAQAKKP